MVRCFYLTSQFHLSGLPSVGPFCFFTWFRQYFISPSSTSSLMSGKLPLLEKCFSSEHTQVLNSRSTHQIQWFWVLKCSGWLITLHKEDVASSYFVWADCRFFKQIKSFLENPVKLGARTVEKLSKRPTPMLVWETELLESPGVFCFAGISCVSPFGTWGILDVLDWSQPAPGHL